MAKFIGRLVNVGIGREIVRGAGAASVYEVPLTSLSFDDKVTKARSVGSLSNIADSEEAFVTTKYGQGDMEGEIRSKSFGFFLYALLGAVSSSGPVDSAYTHLFTLVQSNSHQSLAMIVDDPNNNEMYKLLMLDSLEITAELDQLVMFNAGFISKAGVDTGLSVPAVVAESKFTKKHAGIKLASNIAGLSGASNIALKSLSITFAKNAVMDDVLGTAEPEDIHNQQLSIEGTFSLNYQDETFKNYMKQNTSRAMEIALVNTDDTIGASTRPSLTLQFPKVDFYDWEPNYDNDALTGQEISFKASRDVANNLEIIHLARLINDVVSY